MRVYIVLSFIFEADRVRMGWERQHRVSVTPYREGGSGLNATRFKRMKLAGCISVYVSGGIR